MEVAAEDALASGVAAQGGLDEDFSWCVVFSPLRLPLALHLLLVWQGVYLCVLIE